MQQAANQKREKKMWDQPVRLNDRYGGWRGAWGGVHDALDALGVDWT